MRSSTIEIITFFFKEFPIRTSIVIGSLFSMAAMEAIGIATLMPLMSLLGKPPENIENMNAINSLIVNAFEYLNIPVEIPYIIAVIIITMTLKSVLMITALVQIASSSALVVSKLRHQLLNNIIKAKWSYYNSLATGESVNAMGTEALRSAEVYRQICNALAYTLLVVMYLVLASTISWKLTLCAAIIGLVIILLFSPLVKYGRHHGKQETELFSKNSQRFTEALLNIKPIKAMNKGADFINMLRQTIDGLATAQKKKIIATDSISHASEPIIVTMVACGLYLSITYTDQTIPTLLFFAFLFHRIVTRIVAAQRLYQNVVVNESAFLSLKNRIETSGHNKEEYLGKENPVFKDQITIKNIDFTYGEHAVLKNIDCNLKAHKFHLIKGGSGAGKTTLIDLIVGLHKPTQGQILIDNTPLSDCDMLKWRSMIGYVPQQFLLFNDTIVQNVTLGDPAISQKDVEFALERAGANDFIQKLENGIYANVGEGGGLLSGGQKQRIVIARALVHKPKLLILDESTNFLDKQTELRILTTVKKLCDELTVIMISHQESPKKYADQIIHLEKGEIRPVT